jgi:hypothetical protein
MENPMVSAPVLSHVACRSAAWRHTFPQNISHDSGGMNVLNQSTAIPVSLTRLPHDAGRP